MPAANRVHTPVDCPVCHKTVSRKADLPRHMRTHDENKEALMHACPFPDCDYKTLQKSNVQTHIRTHTRECSKRCPHPGCAFATTDPGTLTRHRKQSHGYEPKVRRNHGGRAARQSATAPYPSRRPIRAEVETPALLDVNALTFSELAGLISCAPSPAESSDSSLPQLSCDVAEFSWEQLFPDLSADSFSSVYNQPSQLPVPIPTSNHFQPPTVPVDLSTFHMPQYESELFPDVNFQYQPVSDVNFQCQPLSDANFSYQPVSGNDLNYSQPDVLEEFLQNNGSGYFDNCRYQYNTTYPMNQPASTSGYNVY